MIDNNRGEDITFADEWSLRGRVGYQNENLQVDVRGSWTEGNGHCCIQDRVPLNVNGDLVGVDLVDNPGRTSNILGTDDTAFRDVSTKIEYDFDDIVLTSISGYAEVRQAVYGDADFSAAAVVIQDLSFNSDVFNQELRLSSTGDTAFHWMFGGYYQNRKSRNGLFAGAEVQGSGLVPDVIIDQDNRLTSKSWAVFGQASFDLTDKLEGLVALRYDNDKQTTVDLNNPGSTAANQTFDQFQPKVQLSYKWTDDVLTYATYSTGFRTGGFSQNTLFKNETTKNYELGFKSTFADGMMTVNASAFHIDYANQQLSFVVIDGTTAQRGVVNIDATDVDGLELEVAARPLQGLDVSIGVGVSNSIVKALTATTPALGDVSQAVGNKSPLVPDFTFNVGVGYTTPVSDTLDLVLRGDYRKRGAYAFDLNNSIQTSTKDFIDARVAIEAEGWSIGLWGQNLTDARHATNVSVTGSRLRVANQPRSYGVDVSIRF